MALCLDLVNRPRLPWRFFWDHVEYRVEQYPQGRLKLTVFTLGLREGWVGV